MTTEFLTVDAAATLLKLHPKTVLRFIREGRLRATRPGKQYRLLRSDLNAFAGADATPPGRMARATSIVDIDDVDLALVERLSAHILGATQGRQPSDSPISLDIAHDPLRRSAKVIIHASPADTATLLGFVDACLEPRP